MFIYLNGQLVKQEDAKISPFDHGYIYGLGVFETFRIYDGHPFLLDDHLKRLNNGMAELNIGLCITRDNAVAIIKSLMKVNNLYNAYIRFNVSAGIGELGLQTTQYMEPTIIVFIKPIPALHQEKEAVILKVNRNSPEGAIRLKSHHFLNNIYGKREIGSNPMMEGIFLTSEGYLAEGVTSNLFFVKGNSLYTPAPSTGILNGITREYVISVATRLGIQVNEGLYGLEELHDADEVFITNSIQEVVPINKVGNSFFLGKDGSFTKAIQSIYELERKMLWRKNDGARGENNDDSSGK